MDPLGMIVGLCALGAEATSVWMSRCFCVVLGRTNSTPLACSRAMRASSSLKSTRDALKSESSLTSSDAYASFSLPSDSVSSEMLQMSVSRATSRNAFARVSKSGLFGGVAPGVMTQTPRLTQKRTPRPHTGSSNSTRPRR